MVQVSLEASFSTNRIADFRFVNYEPEQELGTTIGTSQQAFAAGKSCLTIDLNHLLKITSDGSRLLIGGTDTT